MKFQTFLEYKNYILILCICILDHEVWQKNVCRINESHHTTKQKGPTRKLDDPPSQLTPLYYLLCSPFIFLFHEVKKNMILNFYIVNV